MAVLDPSESDPDLVPRTELINFFVYFQDIFATNFMCLEVMGREPKTQIAGLVALVDMAGMHLVYVITDERIGRLMAWRYNSTFSE